MDKLEAKFQIVTPMYIAGSNQEAAPQLSAKAIKSAIMFWWRALNYAKHDTLAKLYEKERELFGGSQLLEGKKERINVVSPIQLRLKEKPFLASRVRLEHRDQIKGKKGRSLTNDCSYILGQGMDTREGLTGNFSIELICKDDQMDKSVIEALIAFGHLGGLGAKSLKGVGSVSLQSLIREEETVFENKGNESDYIKYVKSLVEGQNIQTSAIPSVHDCDISVLSTGSDPIRLLSKYSIDFFNYRKSNIFAEDKRWFHGGKMDANFHPERSHFGLPHGYFDPKTKANGSVNNLDEKSRIARRESPIRMHIHQISSSEYLPILIHFRSDFLPEKISKLELKRSKGSNSRVNHNSKGRYRVIEDFMTDETQMGFKSIYSKGKWTTGGQNEQ